MLGANAGARAATRAGADAPQRGAPCVARRATAARRHRRLARRAAPSGRVPTRWHEATERRRAGEAARSSRDADVIASSAAAAAERRQRSSSPTSRGLSSARRRRAVRRLDGARSTRSRRSRRTSRRARAVRSTRRRRIRCRARAIRTRTSCASAKRRARRKTRRDGRSSARRANCSQKFSRRSNLHARRRVHLQRPEASSAGEPQSAARRGQGVQSVPHSADRADPAEGDSRARHVRGADTARHEAIDRQVAGPGSSLLRRAADRHVSSRRAPAESGLEAPHLGRCPARPSNTR